MPHYYLTPVLGGPVAPRYSIVEKPKLLGRSEQADVPLLEPTVSRQHAAIQLLDGEVVLEDLGSKHGTFVNSRRITSTKLKPGDVIVFGLTLVLRLEVSEKAPSSAPDGVEDHVKTWTELAAVGPLAAVPTASAPTDRIEIDMLQDKLATARKLASAGALCTIRLPALQRQLDELVNALSLGGVNDAIQPVRSRINAIQSEVKSIVELLGPSNVHLEDVALRDVIDRGCRVVKNEASAKNLRIRVDIERKVKVNADENRLATALIELLRNACQASAKDGLVEVGAAQEEHHLVLAIRDHGSGMNDDLVKRAFDPFITLPADGQSLGLGLLLARQLIMSMGAKLSLESSAGKGTIVRVYLSLAR